MRAQIESARANVETSFRGGHRPPHGLGISAAGEGGHAPINAPPGKAGSPGQLPVRVTPSGLSDILAYLMNPRMERPNA